MHALALLCFAAVAFGLLSLCLRASRFHQFMKDAKHREACAVAVASAELELAQMAATVKTRLPSHAAPTASRVERVAVGGAGQPQL